MRITKEEVLKLAQISMIDISEAEIPVLIERIDVLLNYVSCLKELIKEPFEVTLPQNINVMRDDVIKPTHSEQLLALAPQSESNYFIVPMVLKAD